VSRRNRMIDVVDRFAESVGVRPVGSACGSDIAARWDALRESGIARPGLAFARWVDLAMVGGVVPPLLANCATVGDVLQTLAAFHPLWGDDEVVVRALHSGSVRIELRPSDGRGVHDDTADAFFALLHRTIKQLSVAPLATVRRGSSMTFTPDDLVVSIRSADPAIATMLRGYAEMQIVQDDDWVTRVRLSIRDDVGSSLTLARVASSLAHSPRTVQQRLLDNGTTFSALVDEERRVHALALLVNRGLAVSAVASRVGFRSDEGFSRAVRRWTGMSPTEWRRSHVTD
jgi:AraC-like DNA-binding protein